ncbi:MAG: imidazoleglycerol-phosphate dehydratase HisB [Christensenellaceae bacterium]|jgi:imidazoleglycerol-phosphate dehydratase|nr:imidazoleglycerol-phosphate dehydratase HisB [Christensenellaceae bacterium]
MRKAEFVRKTNETTVRVLIDLDGGGGEPTVLKSGIGFFDHMLAAFARFGLFDLQVECQGDLIVDGHHSVEDCGIVLGIAIKAALGEKEGISRAASCFFPMDEALAFCALDLSGRPYFGFEGELGTEMLGGFSAPLAEEFFRALAMNAGLTLHMSVKGRNAHHQIEALFKAFGRALGDAVAKDPRVKGVPSTKGML